MSDLANYITHTQSEHNGDAVAASVQEHPSARANGQPRLLPCKYDAEHPTFTDPRTLGEHYRDVHAAEYAATFPYACEAPGCTKAYRYAQGLRKHVAAHHGAPSAPLRGRPPGAGGRGGEPVGPRMCVCGVTVASKDGAAKHARRYHDGARWQDITRPIPAGGLAVVDRAAPEPDEVAPIDAAYIMQSVVGAIMHPEGAVPVEHLEAIFQWREATATMLRAITSVR